MAIGEQIRDREFMTQAFQALIDQQQEFPIKVEGAKTLPYTALLQLSEPDRQMLVLKLFRPLPPALAMGAWFDLVFSAHGKRYEGRIPLVGREGYLQYRFQWPKTLLSSDRRLWKRYPFRPRENVHVTAQDNGLPSHGFSGPLTNLSLGGFCFRVDRMVRLEDGMPVRPWANFFESVRVLPMIRIHGLDRDEVMEARGKTVRVQEGDSEIHLAVQFQGMDEEGRAIMTRALAAREQKPGGMAGTGPGPARPRRAAGLEASPGGGEDEPEPEAETETEPALEPGGLDLVLRLDRRTARLLLVASEEAGRAAILQRLQAAGFWRVEVTADLFKAYEQFKQGGEAPFRILLVDLEPNRKDGLEPVAAVRHLESLLRSFGDLAVAFITQIQDPMLELVDKTGLGALALEDPDPDRWGRVLDRLLKR
jgi:CheY-like chemotaxis protein